MNACKRTSHDSANVQAVDLSPEGRLIGWSEKPIITMTTMKNKVQLIGHVGNDPELKNVGSNGTAMLRLRLATNERFKAGAGNGRRTPNGIRWWCGGNKPSGSPVKCAKAPG